MPIPLAFLDLFLHGSSLVTSQRVRPPSIFARLKAEPALALRGLLLMFRSCCTDSDADSSSSLPSDRHVSTAFGCKALRNIEHTAADGSAIIRLAIGSQPVGVTRVLSL